MSKNNARRRNRCSRKNAKLQAKLRKCHLRVKGELRKKPNRRLGY